MSDLFRIDPVQEEKKISLFIKTVLKKQGFQNIVIGLSAGVDSAVSFSLARKALAPQNIIIAHLYYFESKFNLLQPLLKKANLEQKNIYNISIKNAVDALKKDCGLTENSKDYRLRLGNIMARVRMIILYDLAKKHNSLVCGTENKSEFLLGYFTRFGDEASDFEPIRHLYKTQICELAKHLKLPEKIINSTPSAGLWTGQTDEAEFGFSYEEADNVLYLYFDQQKNLEEIISQGFSNAEKVISWANRNSFKHKLPHVITP